MPTLESMRHGRALDTATECAICAYDARFIAVARQMRAKLVTQDVKLRKALLAWTVSLRDATAD
jgi:predicted nucleic acid-binding protein